MTVDSFELMADVEDRVREQVAFAIANGQISLVADQSYDDLCTEIACHVSFQLVDKYAQFFD